MPYIITTTTERATARSANGHELERHERSGTRDNARRAVATLEEATDDDRFTGTQIEMLENGESITLPDGTVIEVAPIEWDDLHDANMTPPELRGSVTFAEIIDAYNARESA